MAKHRDGDDPKPKLKGKEYAKELRKLQEKLCVLQDWVKHEGKRVIIVFEGRDAAGKGGTVKAITERVSPRIFRVIALPAPSDRTASGTSSTRSRTRRCRARRSTSRTDPTSTPTTIRRR
jgi:polyphosphate kinase 2 (PPK2 family)